MSTRPEALRLAEALRENAKLKTVMVAAAEKIAQHWEAHCDDEGYGPVEQTERNRNIGSDGGSSRSNESVNSKDSATRWRTASF